MRPAVQVVGVTDFTGELMLSFFLSTFAVTTLGATAVLFVVQIVDDFRDV